LHERKAVEQLAGGFAVLRHEPVAGAVEWNDASDAARFLADTGRECDHQTAALQVHAALVEPAPQQDGPQAGKGLFVSECWSRHQEISFRVKVLHGGGKQVS
jgi:hypothetical protein